MMSYWAFHFLISWTCYEYYIKNTNVILANAGIQYVLSKLDPCFHGNDKQRAWKIMNRKLLVTIG